MEERYFIPVGYVIIPTLIFILSIITLLTYGFGVYLLILFLFLFEIVSFFILQTYFLKGQINNLNRMILLIIPSIIFLIVMYYIWGFLALITLLSFFALIGFIAINIEKPKKSIIEKPKVFEETKKRLSTEEEKKIIEKIQNSVEKINIKIKQIEKNDIFTLPGKTILLNECKTTLNLINEIKSYKESLSSDCKTFIEKIETEIGILNKKIVALYQKIYERNLSRKIEDRISIINECCNKIENMYTYLIYSDKINLIKICKHHLKSIKDLENNNDNFSKELLSIISDSINEINIKIKKIENYNKEFIKNRKIKYNYLLKTEKYPLDDKQQTAVIKDDKYNLVLAGAGSGKTEVLTNRIAYLINREPDTISPEKILALAFQKDARKEMEKRLKDRWEFNVKIKTFHAFGYEVVKNFYKKEPNLYGGKNHDINRKILINDLYKKELQKPQFQNIVIDYMKNIGSEEKILDMADFQIKREFYEYQKNLKIKTLNGKEVKSLAERDIMNFFLTHKLNGKYIDIDYEVPPDGVYYKNEEGVSRHFYPDFLFKKFDIYLEHWAVGKDNTSYFRSYEVGMNKKKKWFAEQNKYDLIETKAYEYEENPNEFNKILKERFLGALKNREPDKKFELTPINYEELVNKVWKDCKEYVEKLPNHISDFIKIAKVNNFQPNDLKQRLQKESWLPIQITFARIAIELFEKYQNEMKKLDAIDYEDMINDAIVLLRENNDFYKDTFDHILIDEYQDISEQRYKLINELLKKNSKCKLFCVGDDWQSISGFSGSDLNYIIDFEKYFNNYARTDLTTNYRSNKSVVETGVEIISNNSNKLEKETRSNNDNVGNIQIYVSNTKKKDFTYFYEETTESCLNIIQELLDSKDEKHNPNDIMILSRILKNPMLKDTLLNRAKEKNIPIYCPRESGRFNENKIPLMSVHQSKGLEAKTVFILDVCKGLYGFPCELNSPVVFDIVKKDNKEDKESEERRLFYVAVTRARENVFIYTQESEESKFLNEINKYVSRKRIDFSTSSSISKEEKLLKKDDNKIKQVYGGYQRIGYDSRRCDNCNKVIPKESQYCPECGSKLLPIIE